MDPVGSAQTQHKTPRAAKRLHCGLLHIGTPPAFAAAMTKLDHVAHIALATALLAGSGCSLVNRVAPGMAPTSSSGAAASKPTAGPAAANSAVSSSDSNAATSTPPSATAGLAAFEQKFAALLKDEARYSAATAQGKPTVCQAQAGRLVATLWAVETNSRGVELTCFPLKPSDASNTGYWSGIRDVQDHGALGTVIDDIKVEADGYAITVQHGGVFAVQPGPRVTVAFFPLVGKAEGSHGDVFAGFDTAVDRSKAIVDVLTSDVASAKTVSLDTERTDILAKAEAAIKARGAAYLAKEAAALAKVNFPKAARTDAALVKLVHDYLQTQQAKTGIDPALVKKIIVTSSDWSIRKNEYGLILGKTADVTVGFARENKSCAFSTLVVQRDYAGGGTYSAQSYLNGFQSGFEKILCERIK